MSGWPSKQRVTSDLLPYFTVKYELSVVDDCVMRGNRFVIPLALQPGLIAIAHQGHQGIVRTKQRLRACYWWPGMDKQTEHQIRHCAACQASDKTQIHALCHCNQYLFQLNHGKSLPLTFVVPLNMVHKAADSRLY